MTSNFQPAVIAPGNLPTAMETIASPDVSEPEGISDGIWLIATRWLAPVAKEFITAEVSVLIIVGGREYRREYRFTGGDIFSIFNQLLSILTLTASSIAAPLSGGLEPNPTQIGLLQDTLAGLLA